MRLSSKRLILLAAVFHIALAIAITLIGKSRVVPNTFDTNGIGISFALDSVSYRDQALQMAQLLRAGQFRDWINYNAPLATFHARIYSIAYALFGRILGEGILAVEPVNLIYYLSILLLTYLIGSVVFSPSVGRLAAFIVGLWPSLLVYSTQLVRDPLFTAAYLLLLFSLIVCIKQPISLRHALLYGALGTTALVLIMLARSPMWEIIVATVLVGALIFIFRLITTRRFEMTNILAVALMCAIAFAMPKIFSGRRATDRAERAMSTSSESANTGPTWTRMSRQIGWIRGRFIRAYGAAGSNIDREVELQNFGDVAMYLPRAVEIGFLAPFPNMWFTRGVEVGRTGRLIVGGEMLGIYFLLLLAGATLFFERKRMSVWFLFIVATLGCLALAYVVVNIGALYRLRYPYFVPIILLSSQGYYLLQTYRQSRSTSRNLSHAVTE